MLDHFIEFFVNYGNFAVFGVLLLCGFGLPIPEDIILVAGGVLAGVACTEPFMSIHHALRVCPEVHKIFAVAMAGVLIGDSCMYFAGRIFGPGLLEKPLVRKLLPPKRVRWVEKKFEKSGLLFVFLARFMPGLRSPIFVVTGISRRVSYWKFLLTDGLAALISVPIWVYLGFWGGNQLTDMRLLEVYVKKGQLSLLVILAVVIISLTVIFYVKKQLKTKVKFLNEEDFDDNENNKDKKDNDKKL